MFKQLLSRALKILQRYFNRFSATVKTFSFLIFSVIVEISLPQVKEKLHDFLVLKVILALCAAFSILVTLSVVSFSVQSADCNLLKMCFRKTVISLWLIWFAIKLIFLLVSFFFQHIARQTTRQWSHVSQILNLWFFCFEFYDQRKLSNCFLFSKRQILATWNDKDRVPTSKFSATLTAWT